jgi:hypothetical protein
MVFAACGGRTIVEGVTVTVTILEIIVAGSVGKGVPTVKPCVGALSSKMITTGVAAATRGKYNRSVPVAILDYCT